MKTENNYKIPITTGAIGLLMSIVLPPWASICMFFERVFLGLFHIESISMLLLLNVFLALLSLIFYRQKKSTGKQYFTAFMFVVFVSIFVSLLAELYFPLKYSLDAYIGPICSSLLLIIMDYFALKHQATDILDS